MPWDFVAFMLLAAICVICAGGVVASRQSGPLRHLPRLCFIHVAGIFVMLGAEFLAVVQVIVYTGAILVLLLFVLMLVDPDDLPEFTSGQPVQRTVAVLLGLVLLLEVAVAILGRTVKGVARQCHPGEHRTRRRQHAGTRPLPVHRIPPAIRDCLAGVDRRRDRRDRAGDAGAARRAESAAAARSRSATRAGPTSRCRRACVAESPIPDSAAELETGLPSRREVIMVGNARMITRPLVAAGNRGAIAPQ